MPEVDVIITTYNRLPILKQILIALSNQTISFNLVVNDDGSRPEHILPVHEFPIVDRFLWCKDRGYTKLERLQESFNITQSENVIFLDDDCIPQSNDFVKAHVESLNIQPISRGIVRFPDGGDANSWFSGANLGFKREVIQKVGFDMRYNFSYGHEDQDLALELKKHGYKRSAPQDVRTTVMHIGENYAKNDRSDAIIGKNTRLFISKWGFDPRFNPRPWIDE